MVCAYTLECLVIAVIVSAWMQTHGIYGMYVWYPNPNPMGCAYTLVCFQVIAAIVAVWMQTHNMPG